MVAEKAWIGAPASEQVYGFGPHGDWYGEYAHSCRPTVLLVPYVRCPQGASAGGGGVPPVVRRGGADGGARGAGGGGGREGQRAVLCARPAAKGVAGIARHNACTARELLSEGLHYMRNYSVYKSGNGRTWCQGV